VCHSLCLLLKGGSIVAVKQDAGPVLRRSFATSFYCLYKRTGSGDIGRSVLSHVPRTQDDVARPFALEQPSCSVEWYATSENSMKRLTQVRFRDALAPVEHSPDAM